MSSTYTGVPGNVSPSESPTTTIPTDGDALSVASANAGLQKLTDYVANIYSKAGFGAFFFTGTAGNAASTTYIAWLAGYNASGTAMGTTQTTVGTSLFLPFSVRLIGIWVGFANTTAGGTITVQGYASGGIGPSVSIGATSSGNFNSSASPATVSANLLLGISVVNGLGVTTGLGAMYGALFYSLV